MQTKSPPNLLLIKNFFSPLSSENEQRNFSMGECSIVHSTIIIISLRISVFTHGEHFNLNRNFPSSVEKIGDFNTFLVMVGKFSIGQVMLACKLLFEDIVYSLRESNNKNQQEEVDWNKKRKISRFTRSVSVRGAPKQNTFTQ